MKPKSKNRWGEPWKPPHKLTLKQQRVLEMVEGGMGTAAIARAFNVYPQNVRAILQRIRERLGQ